MTQDSISSLVKPAIAELTAMTLFTFCSVVTVMTSVGSRGEFPDIRIPLVFGTTIFALAYSFGRISGAHINPAVTTSMLIAGKISPARAFVYIVSQMLGALLGALCLGLTFGYVPSYFGITDFELGRYHHISPGRAFFIEFAMTFLLLLVVNATADGDSKSKKVMAPLAVGLTVTIAHLVAVPITGCGINPARSFASCIAATMFGKHFWNNHWLYWIAPILGGAVSTILYQACFAKQDKKAEARRLDSAQTIPL